MLDTLPIIIRLPSGLKDKYDTPFNQGIFDTDLRSDRAILRVSPENYNAANPINIDTKLGYKEPYDDLTYNLYKLEATDKDRRSPVKRYVLRDLLNAGGNLSLYGINQAINSCSQPLIAIEDYHELNEGSDCDRGYALRVGTMQVESLKGSYGRKDNIAVGNSYVITPATALSSGAEMNSTEWAKYSVVESYNTRKSLTTTIWQPNTNYQSGERLAAIAPAGVAKIDTVNNGCRIIFTHKYNIVNGGLVTYVPRY